MLGGGLLPLARTCCLTLAGRSSACARAGHSPPPPAATPASSPLPLRPPPHPGTPALLRLKMLATRFHIGFSAMLVLGLLIQALMV